MTENRPLFVRRSFPLGRGVSYLYASPLPGGGVRVDAFNYVYPYPHVDVLSSLVPAHEVEAAFGRPLGERQTLIRADRYDADTYERLGVHFPQFYDTERYILWEGNILRLCEVLFDEFFNDDEPRGPINPSLRSYPASAEDNPNWPWPG